MEFGGGVGAGANVSLPKCISSPMLSASMEATSARLYLMEQVDPSGPSEGLHDQREFGVTSPSWNGEK